MIDPSPHKNWLTLLLLLTPTSLWAHLDPSTWRIVDVSSENVITGELAHHAIDGNPEPQWHSQWHTTRKIEPAQAPHYLTIDFQDVHNINTIRYRARAHGEGGLPKQYTLESNLEADDWTTIAQGDLTFRGTMSPHAVISLAQSVTARFLRFTVHTLHDSKKASEPGLVVSKST